MRTERKTERDAFGVAVVEMVTAEADRRGLVPRDTVAALLQVIASVLVVAVPEDQHGAVVDHLAAKLGELVAIGARNEAARGVSGHA